MLLVAFAVYVKTMTDRLKKHAMRFAENAGRPYEYLAGALTARRGQSKEDRDRAIVERDGIVSGLVAVFATVEPCTSFQVVGNRETHKLEVVRQARKCLFFYFYFYFYFMDRDFGLMHIRLQSWFPFGIQIYVNGREWLCRQLDRRDGLDQRRLVADRGLEGPRRERARQGVPHRVLEQPEHVVLPDAGG